MLVFKELEFMKNIFTLIILLITGVLLFGCRATKLTTSDGYIQMYELDQTDSSLSILDKHGGIVAAFERRTGEPDKLYLAPRVKVEKQALNDSRGEVWNDIKTILIWVVVVIGVYFLLSFVRIIKS